jgi:hypothetical protein
MISTAEEGQVQLLQGIYPIEPHGMRTIFKYICI